MGKKFVLGLIGTVMSLAVGLCIVVTALDRTIGQPEQTKELLQSSGVYKAVIPAKLAETQQDRAAAAGLPIDDTQIQKILSNVLDDKKLEEQGDKAVDSVYAWLERRTDQPDITISLPADSSSVPDTASEYIAELPACSGNDSVAPNGARAACLPAGVDASMVQSYIDQYLAGNADIPVETPAAVDQTEQTEVKLSGDQIVSAAWNSGPQVYGWAKSIPAIAAALVATCAVLLLWLARPRPIRGIRMAGMALLSVGALLWLSSTAIAWTAETILDSILSKDDNPNVAVALTALTRQFNGALQGNIADLGLYTAVAGGVLVIAVLLWQRLHREPVHTYNENK